jgi:hypothetical protein
MPVQNGWGELATEFRLDAKEDATIKKYGLEQKWE